MAATVARRAAGGAGRGRSRAGVAHAAACQPGRGAAERRGCRAARIGGAETDYRLAAPPGLRTALAGGWLCAGAGPNVAAGQRGPGRGSGRFCCGTSSGRVPQPGVCLGAGAAGHGRLSGPAAFGGDKRRAAPVRRQPHGVATGRDLAGAARHYDNYLAGHCRASGQQFTATGRPQQRNANSLPAGKSSEAAQRTADAGGGTGSAAPATGAERCFDFGAGWRSIKTCRHGRNQG